MNNEKTIRYADLFGGVGGFRLGIERASNSKPFSKIEQDKQRGNRKTNEQGALLCPRSIPTPTCVFYCDSDKYAVQTYNKNFKENYKATDVRTIAADSIPDIDMLCGGFPCQAFSIAGKRRGFQDTRGTLFFEIARIIKAKRPKIVFLENVKGLLNHDKGRTFSVIIQTLSELGYDVQWMVFNSKFFGVPQNRERVFIIGSLRGTSRPEILPFGESNQYLDELSTKAGWQQSKTTISGAIGMKQDRQHNSYVVTAIDSYYYKGMGIRGNKHRAVAYDKDKIRKLTPIECERLQGFPDNWTEGVSDTQRYKQMGNAVTVNVIQAIAEKLFTQK